MLSNDALLETLLAKQEEENAKHAGEWQTLHNADAERLTRMMVTNTGASKKAASQVLRGTSTKRLRNLAMQLRVICNHPFLISDEAEKAAEDATDEGAGDAIIRCSSKFEFLKKLLAKLQAEK